MEHPAALGSISAIHEAAPAQPVLYLAQREGADSVGCQLDCVLQGHLDHPIGLCTSARPVLVTLYLQGGEKNGSVIGWGIWDDEQGSALQRIETETSHCAEGSL